MMSAAVSRFQSLFCGWR